MVFQKVIGGKFNVLAVDIYKQVIGQQNLQMGAVVSVVLLIPAMCAFVVDRFVQKNKLHFYHQELLFLNPRKKLVLIYQCFYTVFLYQFL